MSLLDDESILQSSRHDEKIMSDYVYKNYSFLGLLKRNFILVPSPERKSYVVTINCGAIFDECCRSLTHGFIINKVCGDFYCNYNGVIESIDNAPEVIMGSFYCVHCPNIKVINRLPDVWDHIYIDKETYEKINSALIPQSTLDKITIMP